VKSVAQLIAILTAAVSLNAHGQDRTPSTIATNRDLSGTAIRLNLPAEGAPFSISWTRDGVVFAHRTLFSRKGSHLYEMRDMKEWRGVARSVQVSVVPLSPAEFIHPSLMDEIRLFLTPEPWVLSTIVYLYGHTLFGWRWEWWLALLLVLLVIALRAFGKKWCISFVVAYVVVLVLADIRNSWDHSAIVETSPDNVVLSQIRTVEFACQAAGKTIGDGSWSSEGVSGTEANMVLYNLAEHSYSGGKLRNWNHYIFGNDSNGYFLRKERP
jgi:hypothetical protein